MTEEQEAPGLRAQKKADVRAALVHAAMKLFLRRGFDAVTVEELAAAAKVSRRTFFRYFPTKESVVLARREALLERFRSSLQSADRKESAFTVLRRALLALVEEVEAAKEEVLAERALLRSAPSLLAKDLELDRSFESAILECLLLRSKRTNTARRRAKVCAAALVGAVRVVMDEWSEGEGKGELQTLGTQALEMLEPLFSVE